MHEEERETVCQGRRASLRKQEAGQYGDRIIGEDEQDHLPVPLADESAMTSTERFAQPTMATLMNKSSSPHTLFLLTEAKRRGFVIILIAVLMTAGTVLVPI